MKTCLLTLLMLAPLLHAADTAVESSTSEPSLDHVLIRSSLDSDYLTFDQYLARRELRRQLLWDALQTRVLTDDEMKEAREFGRWLNIEEGFAYSAEEKRKELNRAWLQQWQLRSITTPKAAKTEQKLVFLVHHTGSSATPSIDDLLADGWKVVLISSASPHDCVTVFAVVLERPRP